MRRPRRHRVGASAVRRILSGQVIRWKCVLTETIQMPATATAPEISTVQLALLDVDTRTMATLYDQYRIRRVYSRYLPRYNTQIMPVNAASQGIAPILISHLVCNQTTHSPTAGELLQNSRRRSTLVTSGFIHNYKPSVWAPTSSAGGTTSYQESRPLFDQWIETQDQDVNHFGEIVHVPDAASVGLTGTPIVYQRETHVYLEFKNRQ